MLTNISSNGGELNKIGISKSTFNRDLDYTPKEYKIKNHWPLKGAGRRTSVVGNNKIVINTNKTQFEI